ncbi:MAG: hypothetical protein H7175_26835 [Burkholderiales bacterium]|nr:hypothetical protein [Anaerolineae bacterium]
MTLPYFIKTIILAESTEQTVEFTAEAGNLAIGEGEGVGVVSGVDMAEGGANCVAGVIEAFGEVGAVDLDFVDGVLDTADAADLPADVDHVIDEVTFHDVDGDEAPVVAFADFGEDLFVLSGEDDLASGDENSANIVAKSAIPTAAKCCRTTFVRLSPASRTMITIYTTQGRTQAVQTPKPKSGFNALKDKVANIAKNIGDAKPKMNAMSFFSVSENVLTANPTKAIVTMIRSSHEVLSTNISSG